MIRMWKMMGPALSMVALSGCADLRAIPPDECGNGVLEPDLGEDCDGGESCGARGAPEACRLLCEGATPGTPCSSPGYRCGTDGVCRRPSGDLAALAQIPTGTTLDVFSGDVNLDGCHEIFVTSRQAVQITAFEGRDPGACPAATQSLPFGQAPEMGLSRPAPLLSDVTGDGRPDLLRPGGAQFGDSLFVHEAGGTPEVAPLLYPTVKALEESVRPRKVGFGERDALLLFIDMEMGPGGQSVGIAGVVDPQSVPVNLGMGLSGELDDLVILESGELGTVPLPPGQMGTSCPDCEELLAGFAGGTSIHEISVRRVAGPGGAETMAIAPIVPVISLPSGVKLRQTNAALSLVDIDADGNTDALFNTDGQGLFAAYGTGDGRFDSGSPPDLAAPDGQASPFMGGLPQLSSPDFTFVALELDPALPGPEVVPIPCPPSSNLVSSACAEIAGGCEVVVADIDRDGLSDILATQNQEPGIVVRRAGGTFGYSTSFLDTRCPAHHLTAGDFDNDGTFDVAFFDQVVTSAGPFEASSPATTLMISYGNAFAAPSSPVESGRFEDAMGLTAGRFSATSGGPFATGALGSQLYAARRLGGSMLKSGFALVEGYGERHLFAPFYFPPSPGLSQNFVSVEVPAAAGGRFLGGEAGEPARPAVAVMTLGQPGKSSSRELWLLSGGEAGGVLDATPQSGPAPGGCTECVLVPIDLSPAGAQDGVDELLVLGDGEATIWSATGEPLFGLSLMPFTLVGSSALERSFSTVDRQEKPEKHVPRPLVVDLDGDGASDVVLRSEDGALVVLWTSLETLDLEEAEIVPADVCGGKCSAAFLDLSGDAEGQRELVVLFPGGALVYHVGPDRSLSPAPVPTVLVNDPPAESTDFTSAVAADLDGDGVEDLVVMNSSTLVTALRGLPVIE